MWRRKSRRREPEELLQPGELVTVRAYAGYRAEEEPRVIVIGGRELAVEEIEWRATVEEEGRRTRVFTVRVLGRRVRLAQHEDTGWQIERILPA